MEPKPDSALIILQSIPDPELLTGKKQADYALLMTQAMDRNDIKAANDSLIYLAVEYYNEHPDKFLKAKSYFYYAKYLLILADYESSMKYFMEAKNLIDGTNHYKLLGLIHEHIGNVKQQSEIFDNPFENYDKALEYYMQINDLYCIACVYRHKGYSYLYGYNKPDSALIYYQKSLDLITNLKVEYPEAVILSEMGTSYRLLNQFDKAEEYLLKSIQKNPDDKTPTYFSLGYLYFLMEKDELAEKYLKMGAESSILKTQINSYDFLYDLEMLRDNYHAAYGYKLKSDSLRTLDTSVDFKARISSLEKRYNNERLKTENLMIRNDNKTLVIILIVFLFCIAIIIIHSYYRNLNHKKHIKEIESSIASNEIEIEQYKRDIANFEERHKNETAKYQSKIWQHRGKIDLLEQKTKDLLAELQEVSKSDSTPKIPKIEPYVSAARLLLSMKFGEWNRKISAKDERNMHSLMDLIFDDFTKRLKGKYPGLTKHDIELCCFLKLGFSNSEIAGIFNNENDSVTKSKNRLKKRLNLPGDEKLEDFLKKF